MARNLQGYEGEQVETRQLQQTKCWKVSNLLTEWLVNTSWSNCSDCNGLVRNHLLPKRRRKTPGLTMRVLASPLHLTLSASTNFHLRFEVLLAKINNFLPSSIFSRVQCDEPTMATASRLRD